MVGLKDIEIEISVAAQGRVDQSINEHLHNRALRSLKLIYEGEWRLRWLAFLQGNKNNKDYVSIVSSEAYREMRYRLAEFHATGGSNESLWSE